MKLALINGSPRNKKSNSLLLIHQFLEGYRKNSSDPVSVHHLASKKEKEKIEETVRNTEIMIIVFPLYTDSMPGIVKEFFENLANLKSDRLKKIGFIVQSGFPEAIHSVYVERYLEKLSRRLELEYLGTVIKGGVEGIQIMPPLMTRKLFGNFRALGEHFGKYRSFSPKIMNELRKPYKMSATRRFFFTLMAKTGMSNFYWDSNLKKNGAFGRRFERPYWVNGS